jgi:hypothetical protein
MAKPNTKQLLQKREELQEEAEALGDQSLIDAVLECDEELTAMEREAFTGMSQQIGQPFNPRQLTDRQRSWLVKAYIKVRWERQEKQPIELTPAQRAAFNKLPKFAWELNRPLKPPGRV